MRVALLGLLLLSGAAKGDQKVLYLTAQDAVTINKHWDDYQFAAHQAGVPAEALMAIHYREAGLYDGWYSKVKRKVVHNVGGPFMLDLGPADDTEKFTRRIRAFESAVAQFYRYRKTAHVSHDFRFAALVAAHELKMKYRPGAADPLADALWGYNGRAAWQCGAQDSCYVASDPKRGVKLPLHYRHRNGHATTTIDTQPGVLVLYQEVKVLEQVGLIGPPRN